MFGGEVARDLVVKGQGEGVSQLSCDRARARPTAVETVLGEKASLVVLLPREVPSRGSATTSKGSLSRAQRVVSVD